MDRSKVEEILVKACKELKLSAPKRIAAMSTSKSGVGSFQAIGKCGGLKVAIRDHDIVAYSPFAIVQQGHPGPARWAHVTVLKSTDDLAKAFRKALEDKKSSAAWAKELGCMASAKPVKKAVDKAKDAVKVAKGVMVAKVAKTKLSKVSAKAIARVAKQA
jgi:hypothetical protein